MLTQEVIAVATPMQKTVDANGFRRAKDAVLDEEVLKKTYLSSLVNESEVPLEPSPGGALPGSYRDHAQKFSQRNPVTKGDIRHLTRDTPGTFVNSQQVTLSPTTLDTSVGQGRVNEAESLQRCVALQQRSDIGKTDVVASPVQTLRPKNLPLDVEKSDDIPQGPPCTAKPCKSSMPSATNEMKEAATSQKQELLSVRTTSEPKRSSVGIVGKQKTGGEKIITINYREGEQPMSEILRLGGGQGSPVIVEAVAAGSKVAQAGVLPGHALITMNGRVEFSQLPGWQVRLLLESPITLAFDTKPQPVPNQVGMCTEIRLKRLDEGIGVAPKVHVCGPKELGMLAEEVVFMPASAPLFLRSGKSFSEPSFTQVSNENAQGRPDNQPPKDQSNRPCIYELRPRDAQIVVGRAVHGAREAISTLDIETSGDAARSKGNFVRSTSPRAYTNKPGASPSSPLRSNDLPQSRIGMKCVCGPEEDEDNWMNFHSSRSPLRWLAPVLEPVVRALSPSRSPSRTMPPRSENSPCNSPRSRSTTLEGEFTTPHVISSPVLGNFSMRKRKDDKVPPVSRDLSPFRHREKGQSGAVRQSRSSLGGPTRNVHNLSGPRSPRSSSPVSRVPAGDTCVDVFDYDGNAKSGGHVDTFVRAPGASSSGKEPSFSVSWNNDILNAEGPLVLQ